MRTALLLLLPISCRNFLAPQSFTGPRHSEHDSVPESKAESDPPVPWDTTVESIPDVPGGETGTDEVPDVDPPVPGAALFDESSIPEFEITLDSHALTSLRNDPLTYVQGTFTWGSEVYENVAIRTKGSSSWQSIDDKPALKIKFDKYDETQRIDGLSEIILNNMVGDYSMMHERVAYRFYALAGVPTGRAHHAHLTLNGLEYGLYTHIEAATSKMLAPWFEDTSGTMWEFWDSELEPAYVDYFDLKFGKDDRSILEQAAEALDGDGPIDETALETSLNLDAFLRYWAVSVIVAEYDGYPYRYPADDAYLYADPTTGQIWFLPHGVDESFYYPDHDFLTSVTSRLGWKCLITKGCPEKLITFIDESLALIQAEDPLAYFDSVQDQIDKPARADTRKPYGDSEVEYYQAFMRDMIDNRAEQIDTILGR